MAELIKSIIIDGCDTGWKISNRGYTIDTWGRKSYGTLNRTAGYLQVCINKKKFLVHRLVAKHFVANNGLNPDGTPIKGKAQVNHKTKIRFVMMRKTWNGATTNITTIMALKTLGNPRLRQNTIVVWK